MNVGSIAEWSKDSGASRFFPEGYQLEWTGRVREATAKPIVGVARLTNPDRMAEIVSSGAWDLIGAARPSIADPFLPRKVEEGLYGEIRECIGCNVCISKSESGHHLGCTQNATAGEEYRRGWHPERFEPAANADRDVLVVGAGPAGMECAIVLGKRGFRRVHLVEAEPEIGGIMRWIPQLPGLGEWARVVNWRRIQLEKLENVEVIAGTRLSAAERTRVRRGARRSVATGARWAGRRAQRGHARADPRRRRVAPPRADAGAGHGRGQAPARAAGSSCRTQRATSWRRDSPSSSPRRAIRGRARDAARPGGPVYATRRSRGRCSASTSTTSGSPNGAASSSAASRRGRLTGADEYGEPFELEADAVVLVTQRLSSEQLYLELVAERDGLTENGVEAVYRVGDCVAPRIVADAIFDGHRLAREIDSEDPAVPLPYRRERLVLEPAAL